MVAELVSGEPPDFLRRRGLSRCGHCKMGNHLSCHGAVRVPTSKGFPDGLLKCHCRECDPPLRCLDCGNQFATEVNALVWRCFDYPTCQGRVALRRQDDRIWRMIQACKSESARKRRESRLEVVRMKTEVGPEVEDKPAVRSPRPTSGVCECCDAPTRGGRFAPGHDARLKSRLRKKSKEGDKAAYRELVERGWI